MTYEQHVPGYAPMRSPGPPTDEEWGEGESHPTVEEEERELLARELEDLYCAGGAHVGLAGGRAVMEPEGFDGSFEVSAAGQKFEAFAEEVLKNYVSALNMLGQGGSEEERVAKRALDLLA